MSSSAVHLVLTAVATAPLLFGGVTKLIHPQAFVSSLSYYRLPLPSTGQTAAGVGLTEIALATAVIELGRAEPALALAFAYLALALTLERGRRTGGSGQDCGCFGSLSTEIGVGSVWRNIAFCIAALVLFVVRLASSVDSYSAITATLVVLLMIVLSVGAETSLAAMRPRDDYAQFRD